MKDVRKLSDFSFQITRFNTLSPQLEIANSQLKQENAIDIDSLNEEEKIQSEKKLQELTKRIAMLESRIEGIIKLFPNQDPTIPTTNIFICNICNDTISTESRYVCLECADYDVCLKCLKLEENDALKFSDTITSDAHLHTLYYSNETSAIKFNKIAAEKNIADIFAKVFQVFRNRPCLGVRPFNPIDKTFTAQYQWYSYQEIYQKAISIALGLQQLYTLKPGDKLGICSTNKIEWFLLDFACFLMEVTVVAIHYALDDRSLEYILSNSELNAIAATSENIPRLISLKSQFPSLQHVIFLDNFESHRPQLPPTDEHVTSVQSTSSILQIGEQLLQQRLQSSDDQKVDIFDHRKLLRYEGSVNSMNEVENDATQNKIVTILYTSGSTGLPKGVAFSDSLWVRMILEQIKNEDVDTTLNIIYSKDSLAHISDREDVHSIIARGGRVGIISDTLNYFSDLQLLRVTRLSATPRFWNLFYTEYQSLFAIEAQRLLNSSSSSSSPDSNIHSDHGGDDDHHRSKGGVEMAKKKLSVVQIAEIDKKVYAQIRSIIGDRIRDISTGGAATSAQVKDFLMNCFGEVVSEGYACTEIGQIAREDGTLLRNITFKLVDQPHLGYLSTDLPNPRGEIYLKSTDMITNYYNNPGVTNEMFDEEGFFKTGDIVELVGPRKIKIIDRRKNIFKLSQGEFIAPEKLENIYIESPLVHQIFITCADLKRYQQDSVFAVVVPNFHVVEKFAAEIGIFPPPSSSSSVSSWGWMNDNPILLQHFVVHLNKLGREEKLRPFEMIKGIIIEEEPFTVENGKMTSSFKLSRTYIQSFYQPAIDDLAEKMLQPAEHADLLLEVTSDHTSNNNNDNNDDNNNDANNQNPLHVIIKKLLNKSPHEYSIEEDSFQSLGGDSLTAIQLNQLTRRKFGVEFPLSMLFHRNVRLIDLYEFLVSHIRGKEQMRDRGHLQLLETLETDCCVNDIITQPAATIVNRKIGDNNNDDVCGDMISNNILLTGATGFIGAFMLWEILKQTSNVSPTRSVICLVRSATREEGKQKVINNLLHYNIISKDDVNSSDNNGNNDLHSPSLLLSRIEVVCGDLDAPLLSLSNHDFDLLSLKVQEIYHAGAYVNHILPYHSLNACNVGGTKELIKLLVRRRKYLELQYPDWSIEQKKSKFHFFSTLSVMAHKSEVDQECEAQLEFDLLRQILAKSASTNFSFGGYELSKFIAELVINYTCYHLSNLQFNTQNVNNDNDNGNDNNDKTEKKHQNGKLDNDIIQFTIIRIGMTSWDSNSGKGNTSDWVHKLFFGLLELGILPSFPSPINWHLLPVDYLVKCIYFITTSGKHHTTPVFNLYNPNPVSFQHLSKLMPEIVKGYMREKEIQNENELSAGLLRILQFEGKDVNFKSWRKYMLQEIASLDPSTPLCRKQYLQGLLLFADGFPSDSEHFRYPQISYSFFTSHPPPSISEFYFRMFLFSVVDVWERKHLE